jgi:hypothetical protein
MGIKFEGGVVFKITKTIATIPLEGSYIISTYKTKNQIDIPVKN